MHGAAELADGRAEVQGNEVPDRLRGAGGRGDGGEEGDEDGGGGKSDLHAADPSE